MQFLGRNNGIYRREMHPRSKRHCNGNIDILWREDIDDWFAELPMWAVHRRSANAGARGIDIGGGVGIGGASGGTGSSGGRRGTRSVVRKAFIGAWFYILSSLDCMNLQR